MKTLEYHDAANIFPLDEENLDELADDIREYGQQVAIETLDGKIIDGRRRQLACQKAGVQPTYRAVQVSDPIAYVVSLNIHRRHLTPSQRAMCAARASGLKEKLAEQAKQRMSAGGQTAGKGRPKQGKETLPDPISTGQTRDQLGKAFDVSGRSVGHAQKVIDNAVPEVIAAVDEGRMAVDTAAILSTEDEETQRKEAADPKRRRDYKSVSKPVAQDEEEKEEENVARKVKGVGVRLAHEALNCLTRIPKDDALRKRGFQIVTDWIRHNK